MNVDVVWTLIDTTLKVGLGGVIAISAAWLFQRSRQLKQLPQMAQRKLEILENISGSVGQVNHHFAKYSALVIESTRFGNAWPSARRLELESINEVLVREFDQLADAEAKLLMLGEKTMEKTLRLYASRIALFRKQVYVGRTDISDQEISELKIGIMKLREQFYELLSKRYDRLL
jgi:hypothetical protein